MITKLLGLLILSGCLINVYLFETSSVSHGAFRILHWPAIVLTGLGPIGLLFLCAEWTRIRRAVQILLKGSIRDSERMQKQETQTLHSLSQNFYIQGAKAFESQLPHRPSLYLAKTLKRLSVRVPVEDARQLLERERYKVESDYANWVGIFSLGVRLAPSVGMLGTILGMVQLLSSLKDPSNIGSNMSLALLTTFYGLFFSLILWTPLQQKLQALMDSELYGIDQVLHWLELLEGRKPSQYLVDSEVSGKKARQPEGAFS